MSFNTGNPLPSKDILDLYDNSENIDHFANSQEDEHPDRFGVKRLTLAGLIKRSMALRNEINDFSGALTFKPEWSDVPMNVSEGVGGEGGALNLQAEALGNRSEINKIISREALRRSCAEAGYALVTGSFESGGTLVKANDVLLQERTGKVFSGPAGVVAAGTDPTNGGFVDKSLAIIIPVTYAGIRSYSDSSLMLRCVGRQTVFDHGFGYFWRDDSDTTSPDNDGTVLIDALGRRWKRIFIGAADVRWWGAVGDGVGDDTDAIQAALELSDSIVIPDGTYVVRPLYPRDNTNITFGSGVELLAKSGYIWSDCVFRLDFVKNIVFHGNGATVRMRKDEYPLKEVINGNLINSEFRHGIRIFGCEDVTVNNLKFIDCGGDGITVGGGSYQTCKNIYINQCQSINASRNGLAVTNAINLYVNGGNYSGTNRFPPGFGIDIEPNPGEGYEMVNINVTGVYTSGNAGGGISVVVPSADNPISVNISDWTSRNDGVNGGFLVSNGGLGATTKIQGAIKLYNSSILNSQAMGLHIQNCNAYAPRVEIRDITVRDVASGAASDISEILRAGVLINQNANQTVVNLGDIHLSNIDIIDSRNTPRMFIPLYIRNVGASIFKDITCVDVTGNKWVNVSLTPSLIIGNIENVSVEYTKEVLTLAPTQVLPKHNLGATMYSANNSNLTLPPASSVIGGSYSFYVRNSGLIYIIPSDGDVIEGYSSSVSLAGIISRKIGARIKLRAVGAGKWVVESAVSGWGVSNFFGERYPTTAYTAPPTLGDWVRGDIIYNSAPSAGGKIGWVCVTSGSPGVWKAFGAIDA